MSIGLILGTGLRFSEMEEQYVETSTPYGQAFLSTTALGGQQILLLRRHGPTLNIPPHLINYRANMWALRRAGVSRIIATAAVGSLREEIRPDSLATIGDFIDFTKQRESTFLDRPKEYVIHADFSVPYCPVISSAMERAASNMGITISRHVTYVCVDGPRYETPAEVRMFSNLGGDVVGMTGVPEVILARELGMCYGSLAIVTNYAAGISAHRISHSEVIKSASSLQQIIYELLRQTIAQISNEPSCCGSDLEAC